MWEVNAVTPRPYRLGKREATMAETREGIVAAASSLFTEEGFHRVGMDEVARRAGVARVTVYQHFGSKLGLLDAVVADLERRGRVDRVMEALALPDALEAFRSAMRENCRFWASIQVLARKLLGLAAVDPETRHVMGEREQRRHQAVAALVARLAEQGHLREGSSTQQATAALRLLSSFEAFDQLSAGGLHWRAASELLLELSSSIVPEASPWQA